MTEEIHVVVGRNNYYEDGYELIRAFETETAAEEYADSDAPSEDAQYGWMNYNVVTRPFEQP